MLDLFILPLFQILFECGNVEHATASGKAETGGVDRPLAFSMFLIIVIRVVVIVTVFFCCWPLLSIGISIMSPLKIDSDATPRSTGDCS